MMKKILMLDPTIEGAEIASHLEKLNKFQVVYEKKYAAFSDQLRSNRPDLIITELDIEDVHIGELFKKIRQDFQNTFHIVITGVRDLWKTAFAEVNGVMHILFKPFEFKELEKAISETICGRKRFLLASDEARGKYISSCITNQGHFLNIATRDFELNRMLLEKDFSYIVSDSSFRGMKSEDLFRKVKALNRKELRSIAIVSRDADVLERSTMHSLGVELVLTQDVKGEEISDRIKDMLGGQLAFEEQLEKKKDEEKKKEEEKKKPEPKPEAKPMAAEEKKAERKKPDEPSAKEGVELKTSLFGFVKQLETKFYDQGLLEPLKVYMRSRNPENRDNLVKMLDSTKGQPVLMIFLEIYPKADAAFRDFIIDLFADIQNPLVNNLLLMALKDKDPEIRFSALLGLNGKKDERIKTFVQFRLFDESSKVRKVAAKILEEHSDVQVVRGMVDAMKKFNDVNISGSLAFIVENKLNIDENIKLLIEVYSFVTREVKEVILNSLIKTGSPEILPFLLREMKSPDDILSRLSMDGMEKINNPMVLPGIIDYLKVNDAPYIQNVAENLIMNIDSKKYLPMLERVISHGTSSLKEATIEVIEKMGGKESLFLLLKALGDHTASVKMAAIDALATRKKKFVVPSLIYLLDDQNVVVRERATEVLKSMVDKNDIETLLAFFRKAGTEYSKDFVADMLRKLVTDQDESVIEKYLHTDSFHLLLTVIKDKGYTLGKYTAEVLGDKFMSKESFNAILKSLYAETHEARAEALLALGKIGNPEAIPHIVKAIEDKSWFIRRNAMEALKSFKRQEHVPYAERLMDDENAGVRLAALEFLILTGMKYRERALLWSAAEDSTRVLKSIPKLIAPFKDQELAAVYVDKMDAPDENVRIQAACKLLHMVGDVNLKYFSDGIRSKNWRIRLFSLSFYCERKLPESPDMLKSFKNDPAPEIRRVLPDLMLKILHEDALPFLQDMALNDSDIQVRKNALKFLPSFDLTDQMKNYIHELLAKEANSGVLIEIAYAIAALGYALPLGVISSVKDKIPQEFRKIISTVKGSHS
jgi:HEAT repeat protein/DNA-binding NarL/FixJ family response regulator